MSCCANLHVKSKYQNNATAKFETGVWFFTVCLHKHTLYCVID